jgi:serine/threonine-protein kinase
LGEDFPAPTGFGVGSLVAGYRLESQIGAGGMAVVFRARDERLGRRVALKLLTPAMAADHEFRRRFIAESRAAAAVDDPHIIPVYEAGEASGVLFIAMRFVQGGDLRLVLNREGALTPGRAAEFISPVASALDAAHGAGLVHRDVKPANILVDTRPGRPDHVYLSDFGVSKGAISSVALTGAGQFLGTPGYSAPEQIQGWTVDGRTDQYALACVTYQLLAGVAPFERDQGMAVLLAHLSQPAPSITSRRPDLPVAVDAVLAKGLAKTPEKRYESCREFADALRVALRLVPYHSYGPAAEPDAAPSPVAAPHSWWQETGTMETSPSQADPAAGLTADWAAVEDQEDEGQAANVPVAAAVRSPDRTGSARDPGTEAPPAAARPDLLTGEPSPRSGEPSPRSGQPSPRSGQPSPRSGQPGPRSGEPSPWSDEPSQWAGEVPPWAGDLGLRAAPARAGHRSDRQHGDRQRSRRPKRRWPIVTTSLVVLLVIVVGGGFAAWRWSQSQYYVGADGSGRVVIYRGVNQQVLGISMSSPYQATGIQLAQVPAPYQQSLKATDAVSSMHGAQEIVANVQNAVAACHQQYTALRDWAQQENAYRAALAQFEKNQLPAKDKPKPPARPSQPSESCPSSAAFGIPVSALVPAPAGSS